MLIWDLRFSEAAVRLKIFNLQKQEQWTETVQEAVKLKNKVLGLVEKYQEDG